jgi:hypothetical protein
LLLILERRRRNEGRVMRRNEGRVRGMMEDVKVPRNDRKVMEEETE